MNVSPGRVETLIKLLNLAACTASTRIDWAVALDGMSEDTFGSHLGASLSDLLSRGCDLNELRRDSKETLVVLGFSELEQEVLAAKLKAIPDGLTGEALTKWVAVSERIAHSERITNLDQLPTDAFSAIWSSIDDPDDALAASLACVKLNAARNGVPMRTLIRSTLRSASLRAWAKRIRCPSPYPHWVELHGLQGAAKYNGRVGRALAPPNEAGRMPIEVDGGLGECAILLKHAVRILVKPANARPVLGSDLVLVVQMWADQAAWGNRPIPRFTQASLPRKHSCFLREAWLDMDGIDEDGERVMQDLHLGKTLAEMSLEERAVTASLEALIEPLPSARWASSSMSALVECLDARVVINRLEPDHSRDRLAMQNQQVTHLFVDPESGLAPPEWQSGIGDVLAYRIPTEEFKRRTAGSGRAVAAVGEHGCVEYNDVEIDDLTVFDMEILSGFIQGELGSGEALAERPIDSMATLEDYKRQWQRYDARCREKGAVL
tara:strand:+ start:719 stop:2197 length:1479 start_codon:yes stop_codon:yes gene_type:complete